MTTPQNVRIAEQKIWVGDTPIPLMGGEVHYWRLAPENWRAVLERVRGLGIEVVATYVCWDFHETAPGEFDFSGQTDPRRNLAGFLDLLAEMGFWIIIRPGPYIYAEWSNGGVPEYAARYHRLDPAYLPLARRYLAAVMPIITPRQATRGGRIILCQAENELDCWPHMYTESLGVGSQSGLFQEFLAGRYASVDDLNRAWGSAYASISDARATLTLPPGRADWMPRYLDYYRFKHWYVARGAQWAVDTLREMGVDVPIYMNTIAVHSNEPWAEMERIAGLTGTDLYPSNGFHHPEEHRKYLEAARYLRAYSRLPYIAEFEAGVWHGAHVEPQVGALEPNHYRLAAVSALLAGAVGWNWYMLVNRDNWYMSPINEWGRVRPDLYGAFQQITALYRQIDPTTLEKVAALSATIDPLQQAAAHPESEVLRALYDAGLDYDFWDVNIGQAQHPTLLYAGQEWLSAAAQRRLSEYVEAGGHLVCIGTAPRLDDAMRPLNLLELPEPSGAIGDMGEITARLHLPGGSVEIKTRWLEWFDAPPGKALVAERQSVDRDAVEEMQYLCNLPVGTRYPVGFSQPRGRGRITYLGLQPTPALLLALCEAFATPPARCATPGVSAALFQRKGQPEQVYLMLANNSCAPQAADVRFDPGLFKSQAPRFRGLLSGAEIPSTGPACAFLPVPAKDGEIYEVIRD